MLQTIDVDRIKQTIDLRDLAGHHTTLHRESSQELAGPCPKCGGDDRFRVRADRFFCRQCYPLKNGKPHDAVAYIQWLQGADFKTACAILAGGTVPMTISSVQRPQPAYREPQPATWNPVKAQTIVHNAAHSLMSKHGVLGWEYLTRRGLDPATWKVFGLGYKKEVLLPGTWNDETKTRSYPPQAAIVIPWIVGGELRAIRYRFLEKHTYTGIDGKEHKDVKSKSEFGGPTAGLLFGEQTHEPGASALVLCEGELNACSIWQATRGLGVDVLSIGSQDTKLTQANIEQIKRYAYVLPWLDEESRAKAIMAVLPGNRGVVKSPYGKDANDWLQTGELQALITRWLQRAGWAPSVIDEDPPFANSGYYAAAEERDLSTFVGEDVSDEIFGKLQRRLYPGWTYTTRPINGGVHIIRLDCSSYLRDAAAVDVSQGSKRGTEKSVAQHHGMGATA